ncbi:30S ribosomal protein S9 [Candidatus Berkelbacteria bacterium RBG_13_40_8]|uniref:Small ribosomal subunit protein uS9 n=1 Tax=Candidatus Berkelbacteria bacterium RBG_13_40_8 TaxID=1797467 RepID=A0A1F5DQB9_9BACT|nr:MAG: 30S ribosomal protein S9 [Candidatus Berkelbacteria bacterium RBG_13_40_8]
MSTQGKKTIKPQEIKKKSSWYGLGRRKTAIAKVQLVKGSGKFIINEREIATPSRVYTEPLKITGKDKNFDVYAKVYGGGIAAQLEAIRLGISRALDKFDPELHKTLKIEGFLTRDPRMKERKKPGLKGARRAPQWQKR